MVIVVAGTATFAASQPLHDAAAEGDIDRVMVLLERPGVDVNQANKGAREGAAVSLQIALLASGLVHLVMVFAAQTVGAPYRKPRLGITRTYAKRW